MRGSFGVLLMMSVFLHAYGLEIPPSLLKGVTSSSTTESPDVSVRQSGSLPVDNSISEEHYMIGAGDGFDVYFPGHPSESYHFVVNQNGDLYMPKFGVLRVEGLSLGEARESIADSIGKKMRSKGEVYVVLSDMKRVTISVTGAISKPGTYVLSGGLRVLDALRYANEGRLPLYHDMNYRQVECVRGDSTLKLDLFKFIFKNEEGGNPYLYPGDRLHFGKATQRVLVSGNVHAPLTGLVPIRRGESLSEFLSYLEFDDAADTSRILLQRGGYDGEPRTTTAFNRQEADAAVLKDQDIVTIPRKPDYPEMLSVQISGAVRSPGDYPIIKDATTAAEIIELAGGKTDLASPGKEVVLRRQKNGLGFAMNSMNAGEATASKTAMSSVRPEISSGLYRMYATRDYKVIRVNDSDRVVLKAADQIVIPRRDNYVYVSGSVKRPGAYEYLQDKGYRYYIRRAGGYTSKADRANVAVISRYDNVVQIKGTDTVEDGDIIMVPEAQEYKFLRSVLIPIISVTATTIMALVTIYTATTR